MDITPKLRSGIMHPAYTDLRLTGSCLHWVIEATEAMMYSLECLGDKLKDAKAGVKEFYASTPRRHRISVHPSQNGPAKRYRTLALDSGSRESSNKPDSGRPGPVYLYKGGLWGYEKGLLYRDGELNLGKIACSRLESGDFHRYGPAIYLTPHLELARRYRQWAEYKVDSRIADVGILRLELALPSYETAQKHDIIHAWICACISFKHVVWACRNREPFPTDHSQYDTDLLTGHIVYASTKAFDDMALGEDIDRSSLVQVDVEGDTILAVQ